MELKHLTQEEFEQALQGAQPVLADFFATWCGPCKVLSPQLEELAQRYEGRAVVAKVDVDQQQALAQRYAIMSVPTVIFFKDGQETDRKIGVQPIEDYADALDSLL